MRSFKKWFRRAWGLVSLVLLLLLADWGTRQILAPISFSDFWNHDVKEVQKSGEDVEMVFLGASRTYMSFDPEVFEQELGFQNVLNACSAAQPIRATYFTLKETLKKFNPKYVVVGVTLDGFQDGDNVSTQRKLVALDRMTGLTKLEYTFRGFGLNEIANALFSAYRFRDNLSMNYIHKVMQVRASTERVNYKTTPKSGDSMYYKYKGMVYGLDAETEGNIEYCREQTFEETEKYLKGQVWLDKIMKLCEDRGIQVFLVSGPTTMMRIYNTVNYQGAEEYFEKYAAEHGVSYYNLNFLKNREEFLPDSKMLDFNHVNGEGAEVVSKLYAQILKAEMEGKECPVEFYKNLGELEADVHRVVSVAGTFDLETDKDHMLLDVQSLQAEDQTPEYQILFTKFRDEEFQVVSDWSTETHYELEDLSGVNRGYYEVRARVQGEESEVEAFQIYLYNEGNVKRIPAKSMFADEENEESEENSEESRQEDGE